MSKKVSVVVAVVVALLLPMNALAAPLAQEGSGSLPLIWWIVPVCSLIALGFATYLYRSILADYDEGTELMIEIAQAVRDGAMAYLSRQYKSVGIVFVALFVVLGIMSAAGLQSPFVPIAFLSSGLLSGVCGFFGMKMATAASARTANAARVSLNSGLQVAFRSGAVMGMSVVGFALLDTVVWFLILYYFLGDLSLVTTVLISAAMGASTQALFARVGGGIYTKAADVGADLVGKVEAGIPEDDPRNPATIADNVGDNVGDVAGMGADLFESYLGSLRAAAALGVAAVSAEVTQGRLPVGEMLQTQLNYLAAPMIISALGILLSIVGVFMVRTKDDASMGDVMSALTTSIRAVSVLVAVVAFPVIYILGLPLTFWFAVAIGLVVGETIGFATEYYTSDERAPTKLLAAQGETGPATVIIGGLGLGLRSTAVPVIVVIIGIAVSFYVPGGAQNSFMGLYGVALAAVSMLSTLGLTLATDAYGPIADNAGGNAEMAELPAEVRVRTDQLDAVGNTTAATGKGFAIGSAALTALALLASYMEQIRNTLNLTEIPVDGTMVLVKNATLVQFMDYYNVTLMNPSVLLGLFAGAGTVCYFSAMTMDAVGKAAMAMVQEVRRQFKESPGILKGTEKPDYARCVDISTAGAQREMIAPSILAITVPILVGILFGVPGVMGLLAGGLSTGFVVAVMMANAGGAWDNAKKHIEKGHFGGKNSDAHKATVVGDTVGDPFKDTTGPSLNILIKLMSMVSIVFAGLTLLFGNGIGILGMLTGG
ncbi:sodium-translocating pyrophosphatase [Anaerolineales bacterium HSG24]|nr:sodium-translocating pyrophosphatase [Anaerolineales bacterium HSG24]